MQQGFAKDVLKRLPLAEAVLRLWQWTCEPPTLDEMFERNRGPCYTDTLTFPLLVAVISDALLEHGGSARKSFERANERGDLPVTVQAAYQKLGNLPLAVSEAFLAESTQRLAEVFPEALTTGEVAASLQEFTVVIVDGKAVKRVPKRLKPMRGTPGGVLGGKAVVALESSTGLAVAMATDIDGETNDSKLLPQVLPQVRQLRQNVLWVADRQFCDPLQIQEFLLRPGDRVLVRYSKKNKFFPDHSRPLERGIDSRGRHYTQEWGWLGIERNKNRRYVRRLSLERPGEEAVILVTDLLDEHQYPAVDLLEMYLQRWGIERVFQSITEVFSLRHLIGTSPKGTLFQLAFCLLLYNIIQLVRAYVAQGAQVKVGSVSSELLFDDVRRQLIALHEVLNPRQVVGLFVPLPTAQAMRRHLEVLLHPLWRERWRKAPPRKRTAPHPEQKNRHHNSVHRILQAYRSKEKLECRSRK
jgi:hypothetical protein